MRLFFLLALFFSTAVFAQAGGESVAKLERTQYANVYKGNVQAGGSLGIDYSSRYGTSTYISPTAEYFFTDRFAAGGTVYFSTNRDSSFYGLGPSFSYYFWKNEKMAAYAGAGIIYYDDSDRTDYSGNSWSRSLKLGFNYFLTPSVSFGPIFSFSQYSSDETTSNAKLLFSFSVFL